ncbi:MAG: hypothetical protein H7Y17_01490, partial [Chlorobia bacterium]|nr:hypothetical protein [Fimbriimonadaceae bacterium]
PSIFANREYAEAGGLMSYGQNQVDIYQRAAGYVDRILKGAKPADLPVEQPTRLELVINRRTAKALGLIVPQAMLPSAGRAPLRSSGTSSRRWSGRENNSPGRATGRSCAPARR